MTKRNPRAGYLYLFKDRGDVYKYGVSQDPTTRIFQINKDKRFSKRFFVLCYFYSEDVYKSENLFKWFLMQMPKGFYAIEGEFFTAEDEELVVNKLYRYANFLGDKDGQRMD